jgi:exopolysaccharide production protein ExoQ
LDHSANSEATSALPEQPERTGAQKPLSVKRPKLPPVNSDLLDTDLVKWLFSFLAFTILVFVIDLKSIGILILIGLLGAYIVTRTAKVRDKVLMTMPLMIYPALAILSTAWSESSGTTVRLSTQLAITVLLGLTLYRTVPFRLLLSSLFCAMTLACVMSVSRGFGDVVSGYPLVGVFGSKNMMSFISSTLVLTALSLSLSRNQAWWLRIMALGSMCLGAVCVVWAQSAGGMVSTTIGCLVIVTVSSFVATTVQIRAILLAIVIIMAPFVSYAAPEMIKTGKAFTEDVLKKDPESLTGRSYLWQRAGEYIREKPAFGHGYGAFWRKDSNEAVGLWRLYNITNQAGFNFHNQYVESVVDIGVLGLIAFVTTVGLGCGALVIRTITAPNPEMPFFVGSMVALMMRTPVESNITQFSVLTVIFYACCCAGTFSTYAAPKPRGTRSRRGANLFKQSQAWGTPNASQIRGGQTASERSLQAVDATRRGRLRQSREPVSPGQSPEAN